MRVWITFDGGMYSLAFLTGSFSIIDPIRFFPHSINWSPFIWSVSIEFPFNFTLLQLPWSTEVGCIEPGFKLWLAPWSRYLCEAISTVSIGSSTISTIHIKSLKPLPSKLRLNQLRSVVAGPNDFKNAIFVFTNKIVFLHEKQTWKLPEAWSFSTCCVKSNIPYIIRGMELVFLFTLPQYLIVGQYLIWS